MSKEKIEAVIDLIELGAMSSNEDIVKCLRSALAEQPAQKCSYPYCGCNSKAWCKVERNEALDKMAENARELGLDYEPAQQEPVAKHYVDGGHLVYPPAQRTWVGLSPADRGKCLSAGDAHGWIGVMEATEARLKELNT